MYRAMETDRPDAIFRDPFARRLAGKSGEAIVDGMPRGRSMAWPMIVRTAVFDEIILDRVRSAGIDLVVNLAAGLDARPWRMPLPATLRWWDVDLPGILDYKATVLAGDTPVCQYEAIVTDLTDPRTRGALLDRVRASASRALVITEGLLIYLPAPQVRVLADALHGAPAFQWWLTDLASPRLLRMMAKGWGRTVAAGNAPFVFGPEENTQFFEASGWRELSFRSMLTEAHRLHREMSLSWLWRLLARLQPAARRTEFERMSGFALLERVA
jgi:methyltransferase (TIGR00027 family)